MKPETARKQHPKLHDKLRPQWLPGESGNPAGRPKGSRNKLGEDFIADVHEHWQTHGPKALDACLEQSPAAYCKMVASLMPKDVNLSGAQGEQWLEALSNFNDIARAHRATMVKSEDRH